MPRAARHLMAVAVALSPVGVALPALAQGQSDRLAVGEMLPTGQRITPAAAPGAVFRPLLPLPADPDFKAGQAVELAVSPDGAKLLILTSGYNEVEATSRFTAKGLAGFLQKPFAMEELATKLAAALGRD